MTVVFNQTNPCFLFFWLLFGHALADYCLQSDFIAKGKDLNNSPHCGVPWYYIMSAHALIHGGMVGLFTSSFDLFLAETFAHFTIDTLKCMKVTNIHIDQGLHVLCKVLYVVCCIACFCPLCGK